MNYYISPDIFFSAEINFMSYLKMHNAIYLGKKIRTSVLMQYTKDQLKYKGNHRIRWGEFKWVCQGNINMNHASSLTVSRVIITSKKWTMDHGRL